MTQLREGEAPDWSPNGSRIAFEVVDSENGQHNIWIMNADGGELTQITTGRWNDTEPSWSPNGMRIAFASNRGKDQSGRQNYDIWTINTDGTELTQLTTNGSFDDLPEWTRHLFPIQSRRSLEYLENEVGRVNAWLFSRHPISPATGSANPTGCFANIDASTFWRLVRPGHPRGRTIGRT